MNSAERSVAAALIALVAALAPAQAEEGARPAHAGEWAHACLNQKERRTAVENGTVIRLAAVMHVVKSRIAGTVVRARLCHRPEGLVYLLTVLAHDGKVTRFAVDAVKGTLVGGL